MSWYASGTLDPLDRIGLLPAFQRTNLRSRAMLADATSGNATKALARCRIEHVFAAERWGIRFVIRCVDLTGDNTRITLASLASTCAALLTSGNAPESKVAGARGDPQPMLWRRPPPGKATRPHISETSSQSDKRSRGLLTLIESKE